MQSKSRLGGHVAALAAALLLALPPASEAGKPSGGGPPTSGAANNHSAGATALDAQVTLLDLLGGGVTVRVGPFGDPGALPPDGGFLHDSEVRISTPDPLAVDLALLNGAVVGTGDITVAWSSVAELRIEVNGVLRITLSLVNATAKAKCGSAPFLDSEIVDLKVEQKLLLLGWKTLFVQSQVKFGPNTVVLDVLDLVRIVANRQFTDEHGHATVRALEIKVGGKLSGVASASIVVAEARAAITCGGGTPQCPVKDFVTGGGWIVAPSGAKGTFGLVGGQKPNGLSGHLNYVDHGGGEHVTGASVTAYALTTATGRTITYPCTVDGAPDTCVVFVEDNGEPGKGVDEFELDSASYDASGPKIVKGNIQLHKPSSCPSTGGGKKK